MSAVAGAVLIRVATRDDAPAIAALHAASWKAAYRGLLSDPYLDREVDAERGTLWRGRFDSPRTNQRVSLAEQGRALVGFACAFGGDDATWGTQVDNLHVSLGVRHRGIGARLMADVASWCLERFPGAGLWLWVLAPNHEAQAFYRRLGADDVGAGAWQTPDGRTVPRRRYAWRDPKRLLTER